MVFALSWMRNKTCARCGVGLRKWLYRAGLTGLSRIDHIGEFGLCSRLAGVVKNKSSESCLFRPLSGKRAAFKRKVINMSMTKKAIYVVVFSLIVLSVPALCMGQAANIPWGKETQTIDERPAIWQAAEGKYILSAEEVARNDAYRKLLSRIYGLQIDAYTDILDLVLEDQQVAAVVSGKLKGMKELGWKFYDDGRCEVAMQVKIREIIEVVLATYNKNNIADPSRPKNQLIRDIKTQNKETKVVVVGNGALAETLGMKRIRARRVAELDAYRKLAQKISGLQIDSVSTVRDFVMDFDLIQTKLINFIKSVQFTDVRYAEKWAETDGEITIRQVSSFLNRCKKRYRSGGKWNTIEFTKKDMKNRDKVLKVTGKGAITDEVGPFYDDFDSEILEVIVIIREVGVLD